jgi:cytochrome c oxidase assembly factor CtaG
MVQHILLIGAAAPLLALARPWTRLWRGFPLVFRRDVAAALAGPGGAPFRRAAGFAGGALVSWLLFNVNFCAWHLPVLYDAALRWEFVHGFEHLSFFATALLFWTRVIPAAPWRSSLGEPAKLVYLVSTVVVGWVLAIVLALATSPLYSPYAEAASRPGHISALTDQQLAAGVMWVPGAVAYLIAIVVIAYRMLEPREAPGPQRPRRGPMPRGVG